MCITEFGRFIRTSEYEGAELSLGHRSQTELTTLSGRGYPAPSGHIIVYPNEICASCLKNPLAHLTISVNG